MVAIEDNKIEKFEVGRKEKIDLFLSKWVSRKLLVFVVSCFGLFASVVTSGDWVVIATAYISLQGVTDIVERIYNSKNAN
jgi:hypothetical protein